MPDVYACVAEYCLDADDAESRTERVERLLVSPARLVWALLSGFLFGKPA